ncbi:Uma2 family endonuclease [Metabacillus sp. KIGAM252]|uniref:Uma2 family endonuclease n=2 Tax=Metabacillus flavus TaxID=2823519 RepID=A0ABS5LIT7_9BACI|nr:Uma2 family endonuclease [Metabacillus flavus]
MTPSSSWYHQSIVLNVGSLFKGCLKDKSCRVFTAPLDVFLSEEEDVVQPDVFLVCDKTRMTSKGCNGAPDLVIEVLSPSTAFKDRNIKKEKYEKHGVKEYWIIDPAYRMVEVFYLTENRYTAQEFRDNGEIYSSQFPFITLSMDLIFAED